MGSATSPQVSEAGLEPTDSAVAAPSGGLAAAPNTSENDDATEPDPAPLPIGPVVAIARISVTSALAGSTNLTFEGVDGTEITVGNRTIGVLPFATTVPALPAEFEFVATRRGHSSLALGRLDATVIEVSDPVPLSSSRSGDGRREPAHAQPVEVLSPTPFGTAPIHD